jgi:hypothetical protein
MDTRGRYFSDSSRIPLHCIWATLATAAAKPHFDKLGSSATSNRTGLVSSVRSISFVIVVSRFKRLLELLLLARPGLTG